MPTPNRGYVYPSTSSPATVPADLRAPLEQIDADVQTIVDVAGQLAIEVGDIVPLNPDGTAPTALEAQIVSIAQEHGLIAGGIPIFATLAEALAWEAANPGRVALTIEPQTPDETPPNAGTLSASPSDVYVDLTVSGASDDRGLAAQPYAFSVDSGAWSAWQGSPTFRAAGLTPETAYTFRHKVVDASGNESMGDEITATTALEPAFDGATHLFDGASGAPVAGTTTTTGALLFSSDTSAGTGDTLRMLGLAGIMGGELVYDGAGHGWNVEVGDVFSNARLQLPTANVDVSLDYSGVSTLFGNRQIRLGLGSPDSRVAIILLANKVELYRGGPGGWSKAGEVPSPPESGTLRIKSDGQTITGWIGDTQIGTASYAVAGTELSFGIGRGETTATLDNLTITAV